MSEIHVLQLSKYTQPEIVENTKNEWVEYGEDNDYYEWLMCRYRNSTTNNAIINNMARLIYGKGIDARDASRKPNEYAQLKMLFSADTLRKCSLDVKLFGGYALQIIYSKDRKTVAKVEHLPIYLTRPKKCDENGNINGYYYSDNWKDVKKFPPKHIPFFGTSNAPLEILVVGQYSVGRKYFFRVDYEGCLDYCVLEEKISEFLINDVSNSFSGTKVINFNNGKGTPEQQLEQVNKVKGKLTGSTGDKVIISFNENPESKTTIDDVPLDNAPEHYSYLATEAQNKILAGHTVTSSMLVGISPDGQGFSSNAEEINTGGLYFYNTAIKPLQELLIEGIDKVLAFNGSNLDLFFRRLNLLEDLEAVQDNAVAMSKQQSFDDRLFNELDKFADNDLEGWELIDTQDVNYELEDHEDEYINSLNNTKPSFLSKVWEFVSTGTARANAKSEHDGEIFKSRYRYVGEIKDNSREFCKRMIKANKVYRKEDIIAMGSQVVNEGWGPEGADIYSIWLYKGGGACGHKWVRETYLKKSDANSPLARKYTSAEVRKAGEIVPLTDKDKNGKAVNDQRVYTAPRDMPYEGFLPTNKRFN